MNDWLDAIMWTDDGLVPAIAQDAHTGEVLMLAWMSRESVALTVRDGHAVYWSRSRSALWKKGERSGNVQIVRDMRLDCDADTILLRVEQVGDIACHTGRRHCFFRRLEGDRWTSVEPVVRDPGEIYGRCAGPRHNPRDPHHE